MQPGKKLTSEQDGRFQKILSTFLSVASVSKENAAKKIGFRPVSTANDLFDLRFQFEVTRLEYASYTNDDRKAAYEAYRAVRDSLEGYVFIQRNPYYFDETHHALCKVAADQKRFWNAVS
jgi:hypothetical protein